jgi:hypothetical protein
MAEPAVPQKINSSDLSQSYSSGSRNNRLYLAILLIFFLLLFLFGFFYYLLKKPNLFDFNILLGSASVIKSTPRLSITSTTDLMKVEVKDDEPFKKYFKEWNVSVPSGSTIFLRNYNPSTVKVNLKKIDIYVTDKKQNDPVGIFDKKDGEAEMISNFSVVLNNNTLDVTLYFNSNFYSSADQEDINKVFSSTVFSSLFNILRSQTLEDKSKYKEEEIKVLQELQANPPLNLIINGQ